MLMCNAKIMLILYKNINFYSILYNSIYIQCPKVKVKVEVKEMVLVGLVQRETKVVVEDQTPLHAVVARKVAAVAVQKVHLAAATLAKKIKKK